jgi:hypothetical protein
MSRALLLPAALILAAMTPLSAEETKKTVTPPAPLLPTGWKPLTPFQDPGSPGTSTSQAPAALLSPLVSQYRLNLRSLVRKRWPSYAKAIPAGTAPAQILMRARVKRDGAVEDIECIEGREHKAVVAAAKKLLKELNGELKPFSPEMRQIVGSVMVEDIDFSHP